MRTIARQHEAFCKRGWYEQVKTSWGEDTVIWHDGEGPPGTQHWHTAQCETEPMIKAASLEYASPYRYIDREWDEETQDWVPCKRIDQGPRYARAMVELLFGGK